MNIEELSKSQLILLTILVNFVTSVATGILTVSLLDQAPPSLTQTINRVIERTVQTVVPSESAAAGIVPVVQSDQQESVSAIAADAARAVTVYGTDASTTPRAAGSYVPAARAVVVPAVSGLPQQASIAFSNGTVVPAALGLEVDGVAVYRFASSAVLPHVAAESLVPVSTLALGQTALAVTADGTAATGIVSHTRGGVVSTTLPQLSPGSAVVDVSGNLIGLMGGSAGSALISSDTLARALTATSTSVQ